MSAKVRIAPVGAMNRFWLSWYQPTEDYRPLHDPPNLAVLGWWCSGYGLSDETATLCALVLAPSEAAAKKKIKMDWPEAANWRFCDSVGPEWELSDRFPVGKGWMKDRMERVKQGKKIKLDWQAAGGSAAGSQK